MAERRPGRPSTALAETRPPGGQPRSRPDLAALPPGADPDRQFEADRTGAELIGTGEPLARALEKLELSARRVPMDVRSAQAQAFIVNPLTGREMSFANLFRTHPTTAERVARLRSAP